MEHPASELPPAEGVLLEAIATTGVLNGTLEEITTTVGLAPLLVTACLHTLGAAGWIAVDHQATGRLLIRLAD